MIMPICKTVRQLSGSCSLSKVSIIRKFVTKERWLLQNSFSRVHSPLHLSTFISI